MHETLGFYLLHLCIFRVPGLHHPVILKIKKVIVRKAFQFFLYLYFLICRNIHQHQPVRPMMECNIFHSLTLGKRISGQAIGVFPIFFYRLKICVRENNDIFMLSLLQISNQVTPRRTYDRPWNENFFPSDKVITQNRLSDMQTWCNTIRIVIQRMGSYTFILLINHINLTTIFLKVQLFRLPADHLAQRPVGGF